MENAEGLSSPEIPWSELTKPGHAAEAYEAVDLWHVQNEHLTATAGIIQTIERERTLLLLEARANCATYWTIHLAHRNEENPKERPMFGTRVRYRKGNLEISWMRQKAFKGPDGIGRVYSEHIKKGRGFNYPMTRFTKAPAWERQAISTVEARYATIRERYAELRQMELSIRRYEKSTSRMFTEDEVKQREHLTALFNAYKETEVEL